MKEVLFCCLILLSPVAASASGFGVFTQNATALGQANAVVAHPTGPSSLYFNPALLNDVPGRQVEVGTTAVISDREIILDSGGRAKDDGDWNFPSTFYYTHQASETVTAGLGLFFPFGLSNEWDEDYEGHYLGTSGDVFTLNVNPAVSFRIRDNLSVAAGFNMLYLDAVLESKVNQNAAFNIATNSPPPAPLEDIDQRFEGDGWGAGYNIGILFKPGERISIGAAYRSHIDVDVEGDVAFQGVVPLLAPAFPNTGGEADIRLPAQATGGIAFKVSDPLVIEAGVRWEDWESTDELRIALDAPVLGQIATTTPRDWNSTLAYNVGGQYEITEAVALNAGYLYGKDAVPDRTFEPLIPDADAHLFTIGGDLRRGPWTVSGALGFEHHENRTKRNPLGDELGTIVAGGQPQSTANGEYRSDIYLLALSLGYRF